MKQEVLSLKLYDLNEQVSKKHKKVCKISNYIENLLILAFTVTLRLSASAFTPIVGIPVGITSSAVEIKFCAITVVNKDYQSIIKKSKKKI